MSEQDIILSVRDVCKTFMSDKQPIHAVSHVSFDIRRGETLGVVGESGCGKTTLGRCIVRGIPASSGEVIFKPAPDREPFDYLKLDGAHLKRERRGMQLIFQDPYSSLDPRMTVFDIISEPLRAQDKHMPRDVMEGKVSEIARMTGLDPTYLKRYPHAFSGGQRQRIGIARALITYPHLLVCDEAVSALDVSIQAQIINLLMDLQSSLGLTYIFISHSLSVVEHISDRVAVMYLGRVVELADTKTLFFTPRHPYTEALLSAHPQPDPDKRMERIILGGEVPNPANPPKGCHFHPRCPYATPECAQKSPALRDMGEGRLCACDRAEELTLRGIKG